MLLRCLRWEHLEPEEQGWFLPGFPGPTWGRPSGGGTTGPRSLAVSHRSGFSPVLLSTYPTGGRVSVSGCVWQEGRCWGHSGYADGPQAQDGKLV